MVTDWPCMNDRYADHGVQYRCGLTNKVQWINEAGKLVWDTYFTMVVNEDTGE